MGGERRRCGVYTIYIFVQIQFIYQLPIIAHCKIENNKKKTAAVSDFPAPAQHTQNFFDIWYQYHNFFFFFFHFFSITTIYHCWSSLVLLLFLILILQGYQFFLKLNYFSLLYLSFFLSSLLGFPDLLHIAQPHFLYEILKRSQFSIHHLNFLSFPYFRFASFLLGIQGWVFHGSYCSLSCFYRISFHGYS